MITSAFIFWFIKPIAEFLGVIALLGLIYFLYWFFTRK